METREIANESVVTIEKDEPLLEAAESMRENHVGDVIVVEHDDTIVRPIGILTDRDVTIALAEHGSENLSDRSVGDEMTDVLVLARRDESVRNVLTNMRDNGVRRLPVVDADDDLVGIVTYDDFVGAFGAALNDLGQLVQEEIMREMDRR